MRRSAILYAICCLTFLGIASTRLTDFEPNARTSYKHFGLFHVFDLTFSTYSINRESDPLGNFPKSLEFTYSRKISQEQLIQAAEKILRNLYEETVLETVSLRMEALNAAYREVGSGDCYTLRYYPEKGTTLSLNDKELITIDGDDFQGIYFSIWLSPQSPFNLRPI
ncbi:MAG: hypothetical protein HN457_08425 [Opitutales bacterium]|nr:hypothetical protein [Opitutales bacterium]MBT5169456.1 hypothetical protein [Opitutales bacterium]MBT5814298.1 hypothetical protein [Opitutales bacterium]MBT6769939.1 hypothetical protein [Opitutales bacterium]